jgi:hypothetical protein
MKGAGKFPQKQFINKNRGNSPWNLGKIYYYYY